MIARTPGTESIPSASHELRDVLIRLRQEMDHHSPRDDAQLALAIELATEIISDRNEHDASLGNTLP